VRGSARQRTAGLTSVAGTPSEPTPTRAAGDEASRWAFGRRRSLRNLGKLLEADEKSGRNASHTGSGLLSETRDFARQVIDACLLLDRATAQQSIRDSV